MRFNLVKAIAFGPLKNRELRLAPGLNIIHGPNEAGKSNWHGALFASLCGRRRGAGITREERAFADQYRPWDGDRWEASAEISLADGRQIELRHDLEDRIDCAAIDLRTGRDLSSEIMYDGAPDGAALLGLDRRSFYAVACVRQADVLGIKQAADGLQVHLQRAAATAIASSTAAEALRIIDTHRRDEIGTEQAPTKPLAKARVRLRQAEAQLELAKQAETDLSALRGQVKAKRNEADLADRRVRLAEAKRASVEASALQERLDKADRLAPRFSEGEPPQLSDDAAAAEAVAVALQAWEQRPRALSLSEEDAGAIEQALSDLPDPGDGDLEEDTGVRSAADAHRQASALLEGHRSARPEAQEQAAASASSTQRTPLLLAGFATAVVAVVLVLAGLAALGLLVGLAGAAVVAYAFASGKQATPSSATSTWRAKEEELWRRVEAAEGELRTALEKRDIDVATGRISEAYQLYRESCQQRRRRAELMRRLVDIRRLQEAVASLRGAATSVGMEGNARSDELAESLRSWQVQRSHHLQELDAAHSEWTALKEVLADIGIEDLRAATLKRQQEARELRALFTADELDGMELEGDVQIQVQALRANAQQAREDLATLEERLSTQEARFPDLAAALEERDLAEEDRTHLQELDRILARTRAFLADAAERAHNNIAPALQSTLERWLPYVTSGRYSEARVDPQDLCVRVRAPDGNWREADRLSHGTAEQVYLLLRVALAEQLGNRNEPCPLVLDDVTAHTDRERTVAILEALSSISEERQVIFFSQEAEVLEWARANHDRCNLNELSVIS